MSWETFHWEKLPNGVEVHLARTQGKDLLLSRRGAWSYYMPACSLRRGHVLRGVVRQLGAPAAVCCASIEQNGTLHVLLIAETHSAAGLQRVDNALLLSGFVGQHPAAALAAHVLQWFDAEKYLPLPALAAPFVEAA
jgi:hypothetical protein